MSSSYKHLEIEKKWQEIWEEKGVFHASDSHEKPKFYALVEFPYPSGQGLHVGHPRSYTAIDIIARKRRMQGFNVLYPMGWDAFGLPTENYAIKNNIHPAIVTKNNIKRFKKQLQSQGYSFDWSREINTTDPEYYKWTQWIFLKLFEKGLAYKSQASVNWCTSCKCVLANEEVVNGKCERCSSEVIRKNKSQWMLKITEYAQRLIDDLDLVDYPEKVRAQQINWIGRSSGAEVYFKTTKGKEIKIFTTRPETIFGATYLVISPEHPLVSELSGSISNLEEIQNYKVQAGKKSDLQRTELSKEKTGVKIEGVEAINPVSGEEIPIFVADYVLMSYASGAIMAVPAHDSRDGEFAEKYGLPVKEVISENGGKETMVNSEFLNGLTPKAAKKSILDWLSANKKGNEKINFKLRDWVFSRQRYWGEPIPVVHCEKCGYVPLKESDLPLKLPDLEKFETSPDGESPLVYAKDWVNTTCPKCGGKAKRETDTMPQWAGSSWYFLRYLDPKNSSELASPEAIKYWMPVDWYNGGMEHVTRHMIYSRFWHKFLYDIGVVPCDEPYAKRTAQGLILGPDGEKMSKSKGNVVDPNDVVDEYGADVLRTYVLFMGDYTSAAPWSESSVRGCKRFIERVWGMLFMTKGKGSTEKLESAFHKTVKKVSSDIEQMKFNTAIAAMMSLTNDIYENGSLTTDELGIFVRLLCPFAPHICEELWERLGGKGLCSLAPWPVYDESKTKDDTVTIAVQICGKLRDTVQAPVDSDQATVEALAKASEKIAKAIDGKQIVKEIYVKNKIFNIVVK